MLAFPWIRRN